MLKFMPFTSSNPSKRLGARAKLVILGSTGSIGTQTLDVVRANPGEFEVVMDESELIEDIVDDLLNQLGDEGAKRLNELIFSYARTNLDEGNQWNFRRSLVKFAAILKNEKYYAVVDELLRRLRAAEFHDGPIRVAQEGQQVQLELPAEDPVPAHLLDCGGQLMRLPSLERLEQRRCLLPPPVEFSVVPGEPAAGVGR